MARTLIHYNKELENLVAAKTEELNDKMQLLEEANLKLELIASQDGLTGISNRRHFNEALANEWRRALRNKTKLSLIIADIDSFKLYNDNYGHLNGDKCLKKIANELYKIARRPGDTAARYGGEEFVLLLPETAQDKAMFLAQKLQNNICKLNIPHNHSKVARFITLSFGIATMVPNKQASPDDLIESADQALYRAKEEGRNQIIVFNNEYKSHN